MPHNLTVKNLMNRISIYKSLQNGTKSNHFLNDLLRAMKNGSRTTIMYNNEKDHGRSEAPQTVAKPGLTPKK